VPALRIVLLRIPNVTFRACAHISANTTKATVVVVRGEAVRTTPGIQAAEAAAIQRTIAHAPITTTAPALARAGSGATSPKMFTKSPPRMLSRVSTGLTASPRPRPSPARSGRSACRRPTTWSAYAARQIDRPTTPATSGPYTRPVHTVRVSGTSPFAMSSTASNPIVATSPTAKESQNPTLSSSCGLFTAARRSAWAGCCRNSVGVRSLRRPDSGADSTRSSPPSVRSHPAARMSAADSLARRTALRTRITRTARTEIRQP
jgi:hypothetical protein